MMSSINVTAMVAGREWIMSKRMIGGMVQKDLLIAAEEKAASCEMEEISCNLPENTRSTFLVTFSLDGTKVASAHGNHKIYVCDVRTGRCLHTLEGHPRTPWCLAFHPAYNDVLASGCLGGEVRVWDLHGGCEVWMGERSNAIASLAFHPNDQVLVIATTNMIYFWDWNRSQPFAWCKTASERERVRFVQFDPYGHRLFTGIANVSALYKHRDELGRPMTTREREQEQNSLRERLLMLYEQHRQLLTQLQELRSRAEASMEEVSFNAADQSTSVAVSANDYPPSPAHVDALRRAREYAAEVTSSQNQTTTNENNVLLSHRSQSSSSQTELGAERLTEPITSSSVPQRNNLNTDGSSSSNSDAILGEASSGSVDANADRSPPISSESSFTTRMSFQELQENLRSMRMRYSRICERLRELLAIHSRGSDESTDGGASDASLVYSLLTFWREYETLAISLQHTSLQYNTAREPSRDARRHIAVAMVSLLQLQEMLQTNILHRMNDVSERGMARLIHSILMTLLELATLDTNILALRTTALEAIGRTMHAQWSLSLSRPESRRQSFSQSRNQPTSLSDPSASSSSLSSSSSLPSITRMNPMSWHAPVDFTPVAGGNVASHVVNNTFRRHSPSSDLGIGNNASINNGIGNDFENVPNLHVPFRDVLSHGHGRSAFEPMQSSSSSSSASAASASSSSSSSTSNWTRPTSSITGLSRSEAVSNFRSFISDQHHNRMIINSLADGISMRGIGNENGNGFEGATDGVRNTNSNEARIEGTHQQHPPQEIRQNLSNTEQLIRSILEELLSLLGSSGQNGNSGTGPSVASSSSISRSRSPSSSTTASSSSSSLNPASFLLAGNSGLPSSSVSGASLPNVVRPSPSFPASWYPYWWNHLWNMHSAGFSEPLLVTRPTYRIQCWDFTKFHLPDISNAQSNVIVPECLIQNDASIEVSSDGRLLATLVPSSVPTSTLLAVHSLLNDTFGQCLYLWSFGSSVISVSLSPLGRYALVGLGSNRRLLTDHDGKLVIGQVLQLVEGKEEKEEYLQHVRTVELRGENRFDISLNSMRWLPRSGEGLVYGTNKGDLRICRPRSCTDPWSKTTSQKSSSSQAPRQMYRDLVARVLTRRPIGVPSSLARLVVPTSRTTGTQTESDSDSG